MSFQVSPQMEEISENYGNKSLVHTFLFMYFQTLLSLRNKNERYKFVNIRLHLNIIIGNTLKDHTQYKHL